MNLSTEEYPSFVRIATTATPFAKVELFGRLLQQDGAVDHAKFDLCIRSKAELLSNVLRDRDLTSFARLHTS